MLEKGEPWQSCPAPSTAPRSTGVSPAYSLSKDSFGRTWLAETLPSSAQESLALGTISEKWHIGLRDEALARLRDRFLPVLDPHESCRVWWAT